MALAESGAASLVTAMSSLVQDTEFADFTVTCGDKTWKLHSNILALRSHFFKAAIVHIIAEKLEKKIDITDLDLGTMDEVINYMYGKSSVDVPLKFLLEAADRFQMDDLKIDVAELAKQVVTVDKDKDNVQLAEKYGADGNGTGNALPNSALLNTTVSTTPTPISTVIEPMDMSLTMASDFGSKDATLLCDTQGMSLTCMGDVEQWSSSSEDTTLLDDTRSLSLTCMGDVDTTSRVISHVGGRDSEFGVPPMESTRLSVVMPSSLPASSLSPISPALPPTCRDAPSTPTNTSNIGSEVEVGDDGEEDSNISTQVSSPSTPVRYACEKCDYKTKRTLHLRMHVEAQHDGVRYDCKKCNYRAKYTSNLKKHMQDIHHEIRETVKEEEGNKAMKTKIVTSVTEDDNSARPGDLVWGRMSGFPHWPGFVTKSPRGLYKKEGNNSYHIQFFNWNAESGWVNSIVKFDGVDQFKKTKTFQNMKLKGLAQKWYQAARDAEETIGLSQKERLDIGQVLGAL